jgi:MoxR-like ATPase
VLLDEVDKAHPDVLTVLLQLFEEVRFGLAVYYYYYYYYYYYRIYIALFHEMVKALTLGRDKLA